MAQSAARPLPLSGVVVLEVVMLEVVILGTGLTHTLSQHILCHTVLGPGLITVHPASSRRARRRTHARRDAVRRADAQVPVRGGGWRAAGFAGLGPGMRGRRRGAGARAVPYSRRWRPRDAVRKRARVRRGGGFPERRRELHAAVRRAAAPRRRGVVDAADLIAAEGRDVPAGEGPCDYVLVQTSMPPGAKGRGLARALARGGRAACSCLYLLRSRPSPCHAASGGHTLASSGASYG